MVILRDETTAEIPGLASLPSAPGSLFAFRVGKTLRPVTSPLEMQMGTMVRAVPGNAVPCAGLACPRDTPGVLGTAVPRDSMPSAAVPCVAPPGASPALPRAAMVGMPAAMAGVAVAMPGLPGAVVRLQVASAARVGCVAHAAAPCAAAPHAAAPSASMPGVAQLGAMLAAAPSGFLVAAAMPLPSACSASCLTLSHVSGGGAQAQRYRSWPPLAQAVVAAPLGVPVCGAYSSPHSQGSME
mmetsp:Transcript_39019/g.126141  ORF Transcript_39019/g.126141 Transcript_39019/m.126141 type:complete len:241 (-) Transcript_39019:184-906(-)